MTGIIKSIMIFQRAGAQYRPNSENHLITHFFWQRSEYLKQHSPVLRTVAKSARHQSLKITAFVQIISKVETYKHQTFSNSAKLTKAVSASFILD